MLNIREATPADILQIAPAIRPEDVDEVYALTGDGIESSLQKAFSSSHLNYVAEDDEGLVCVFGLSELEEDPTVGIPWLLGTTRLFNNKKDLIKTGKFFRDQFQKKYEVLTNIIDIRNTRSIKWLIHLGFSFPVLLENFGHEKRTFLQFVRYRDV